MDTGWIIAIVTIVVGIIVGIIGFFLKRTINQHDELKKQVDKIDGDKASKVDLCEVNDKVVALERTTGEIKTNYLTKEDFFREQAKTDRKLDDITKYLLQIMQHIGGGKNG